MSSDRDTTRIVRSWLEDGATRLPDSVLDSVLDDLPTTPQRRATWWPARRYFTMNTSIRFAVAAAVVVVASILGYAYLAGPNVGSQEIGDGTPSPGASLEAGLPILDEQEGPLEPGTYVVTDVEPMRIGITVPAGWTKNFVDAAVWTQNSTVHIGFGRVDNIYADPCAPSEGLLDPPVGSTVDDLATAFADLPGLNATMEEVAFSGYSGKYVELAPSDPIDEWCSGDAVLWELPNGEQSPGPGSFGLMRMWIVDVAGDRLVMAAEVRSAASSSETAGLQQIVDSIQIDP
jgi:hypothetical protein